jgi:CRP-like cAMP-binding protein
MAVAQRVLDTAAELEALIKGRTVKVEQPERPSLADEVFQVAFEVEARVKGEGQVPFTGEKGDARGVFGEWPMTSSLSPSEKEKLEAVMGVVHLRAGQPAPEDEALMLVASGLLQQRVEGGLPQVLGQGEPVYLELFAGASRPHGQAVAIKDAILLHGIHQDVMDMLRQEPELSAKLGWLIARQLAIHSV